MGNVNCCQSSEEKGNVDLGNGGNFEEQQIVHVINKDP